MHPLVFKSYEKFDRFNFDCLVKKCQKFPRQILCYNSMGTVCIRLYSTSLIVYKRMYSFTRLMVYRLNNELDLIDTQQKELEEILGPLEEAVGSYIDSTSQHTDQERKTT